jgi:hypothetical protein
MSNVRIHIPPPPPEQEPTMVTGNPEEPQVASEEYDPGEYTVDEVKAYVEENPDQAQQVLMAEQAGKARVTLIDWLEESVDEEEAPAPEGPT